MAIKADYELGVDGNYLPKYKGRFGEATEEQKAADKKAAEDKAAAKAKKKAENDAKIDQAEQKWRRDASGTTEAEQTLKNNPMSNVEPKPAEEHKFIQNTNAAVAAAKPGDWIRTSKYPNGYQLKQADIDWAKRQQSKASTPAPVPPTPAPVPPVPPTPAPEAQPDVQPEALSNENRYTMSAGAEDKDGNGVITLEEAQAAMKEAEAAYIRAKQVYNAKKAEAKKAKMASMPANPAQAQQNMGNGPATN